jgi:hypothetical protein
MGKTPRSNLGHVLVNNLEGTSVVDHHGTHSRKDKRGSDIGVTCHASVATNVS